MWKYNSYNLSLNWYFPNMQTNTSGLICVDCVCKKRFKKCLSVMADVLVSGKGGLILND